MFWECLYLMYFVYFFLLFGSSIRILFLICFVESCDGEFVICVVMMWLLFLFFILFWMMIRFGGRVWEVEFFFWFCVIGRLLMLLFFDVILCVVLIILVGIIWIRFGDFLFCLICKFLRFLDVIICKGELFIVWIFIFEGWVVKFVFDSCECIKMLDNIVFVCVCLIDFLFCWLWIIIRLLGRVVGEGLWVELLVRFLVFWSERIGMFSFELFWGWIVWGMMMLFVWKFFCMVGGVVVVDWGEVFGL